jgi:drug/metabolite transporter (DMT)-like permease
MKVITFFIMVGLLGVSYAILDGGLNLADVDDKSNIPATRKIISTLMALAVVALALCFRAAMNVLSEMRHPNTQTSKTMFIVCTTVIYHFLYFLIIPTIFFFNAQQN